MAETALRAFRQEDAEILSRRMPDTGPDEAAALIREWERGVHEGRRFEMYAITLDGAVAGSASLYEHSPRVASFGIEVFPEARGQGCAAAAGRLLTARAAAEGFRLILDQVAVGNVASAALHRRLGFETDGYVYRNARGREVCLWLLFQ
jgi:RimJ/RimL family protein N-acetyltransferase